MLWKSVWVATSTEPASAVNIMGVYQRSAPLNCALRRDRRRTIIWCESAKCSNTRSKRDRSPDCKFARSPLTDKIIVGQETVAELPGIQPIPGGWNF